MCATGISLAKKTVNKEKNTNEIKEYSLTVVLSISTEVQGKLLKIKTNSCKTISFLLLWEGTKDL